jgi:glycerol uptake facilitator-like aquaporin
VRPGTDQSNIVESGGGGTRMWTCSAARRAACMHTHRLSLVPLMCCYTVCQVSAKLNPAMCLAQWVWGNLTGADFVALSLSELAGAFVGAGSAASCLTASVYCCYNCTASVHNHLSCSHMPWTLTPTPGLVDPCVLLLVSCDRACVTVSWL